MALNPKEKARRSTALKKTTGDLKKLENVKKMKKKETNSGWPVHRDSQWVTNNEFVSTIADQTQTDSYAFSFDLHAQCLNEWTTERR